MTTDTHKKTAEILLAAGKRFQELQGRRRTLLGAVTDAYKRQATNRDRDYREQQMVKVNEWLEELTQLHEQEPALWTAE